MKLKLRDKLTDDIAHFEMVKRVNEGVMEDFRHIAITDEIVKIKVAKMETCNALLKGVIDRLKRTLEETD